MPSLGAEHVLFGAAGDAGVVHQHVESAEPMHRRRDYGGPVVLAGDVEPLEPRCRADRIRLLPAFMLQHVGDHHAGTFARKQARAAAPMPDAAPLMMATFPASRMPLPSPC